MSRPWWCWSRWRRWWRRSPAGCGCPLLLCWCWRAPLARLAGFGPADRGASGPGHEETIARLRLAEAGLARLDELAGEEAVPDTVIDLLRASLQARVGTTRADLAPDAPAAPEDPDRESRTEPEIRRELIAAENAELARLFADGTITAVTRQRLQHSLDLEVARLAEGQR